MEGQPKEKELIEACLRKDRLAEKRLYDKHKIKMFSLALQILGDKQLAEDALQAGFIKVFAKLGQFKGEAPLETWIRTIILRECGALRGREGRYVRRDDFEDKTAIDWQEFSVATELGEAIAGLPRAQRAVFILAEKHGYKHREVAAMLGITETASQSTLMRAKQALRKKLGG